MALKTERIWSEMREDDAVTVSIFAVDVVVLVDVPVVGFVTGNAGWEVSRCEPATSMTSGISSSVSDPLPSS